MNKIILVTALAISFPSLAGPILSLTGNTEVYTQVTASKAEAYKAGIETLQELKSLTGKDAYNQLNLLNSSMIRGSIIVNDGKVFVDEFADSDGTINYQGKLKITYSYQKAG